MNKSSQLDSLESWPTMMQPYRTVKLWIMHMDLVSILRSLLRSLLRSARRCCRIWLLRVTIIRLGSLYSTWRKWISLRIHIHPSMPNSERYICSLKDSCLLGIFGDLYIEQVFMGNIKSVGGLTRRRGFEESSSLV